MFQLDDQEFDIPVVENPPTLESILNEVHVILETMKIDARFLF